MKISIRGALLGKELWDDSYLEAHPKSCELFKIFGCYRFYQKLQGYQQGVTKAFQRVSMGLRFNLDLY
jgi:hypothetical protein